MATLAEQIKEWYQLYQVNKDGYNIIRMESPSEKVQLAAVQNTESVIQYIKNPSEQVQLAAVNQNPDAILHIENPSEEVQLAAVQQNGNYIQTISNPSERVQLAAVNQHGYFIEAIDNPSERVQMVAIEKDLGNITLINSPSEAVQIYAAERDPFSVSLYPSSEAARMVAIEIDPKVITHIENPSPTLCKAAIEAEFPGTKISYADPFLTKELFNRIETTGQKQSYGTLENERLLQTRNRIEAIQVLQGNAPEQILEERFSGIRKDFSYEVDNLLETLYDVETGGTYTNTRMMSDNLHKKLDIQEKGKWAAETIKNYLSPTESLKFAEEIATVSNLPLGKTPTPEETLSLFSNQFRLKEFTSSVFENERTGQYEFQSPSIKYQQGASELLHAGTHPYSPNYKEVFEKAGLKKEFNNFEKVCCARSQWNDAYKYAMQAHDIAEIGDLERKLPTLNEKVENNRNIVYNQLSNIKLSANDQNLRLLDKMIVNDSIKQAIKKEIALYPEKELHRINDIILFNGEKVYLNANVLFDAKKESISLQQALLIDKGSLDVTDYTAVYRELLKSNVDLSTFTKLELETFFPKEAPNILSSPAEYLTQAKQIVARKNILTALSEYRESAQNLIDGLTTKIPTATALKVQKINALTIALSNPQTAFAIGEKSAQYTPLFKELGLDKQFSEFKEKWEQLNQLCELSSDSHTANLSPSEKKAVLKEFVAVDDAFEKSTMELITAMQIKEKALVTPVLLNAQEQETLIKTQRSGRLPNDAEFIHKFGFDSEKLEYDSLDRGENGYFDTPSLYNQETKVSMKAGYILEENGILPKGSTKEQLIEEGWTVDFLDEVESNIHSTTNENISLADNYKMMGYDSVAASISEYAPNYNNIITSGSSSNYKIENVNVTSAGSKTLIGDISISQVNGKPTSTLENLHIKDKSTGLTEPLKTNGIDLSKHPADTVKKLLSGNKVQTSSAGITQMLGLSKTPLGWGITIGKQVFNSADSSAGI